MARPTVAVLFLFLVTTGPTAAACTVTCRYACVKRPTCYAMAMRVRTVGDPLPPSARRLLARHGFELAEGATEGIVTLADGHLVLTLPIDQEAAAEDAQPAGKAQVVRPAGGTGAAAPSMTPTGASAGVASLSAVAASAAAAHRRRHGQRTGPRPAKPRRETAQRIADCRAEGKSLRQIVETLEDEDLEPPGGGTWYATTVKRIVDMGVAETRLVLRRVGNVLADIEGQGSVTEQQLAEIGKRHLFHHHRLLHAFEREVGAPYVGRFTPVLKRSGTRYRVSRKGSRLLALWQRSEDIDDRIEQLLLDVAREHDGSLEVAALEAWCTNHALSIDDLVPRFLAVANGRLALTTQGREIASTWRRIVDPDPRERLDIDFWPEPHEERRLPPTWDWEDDPLAVLGK